MNKLLAFACIGMLLSCNNNKTLVKTGLEGKPLPEFKILLSDSTTILDSKNIPSGHPVALFCFGPHCPYSKAQMQEILNNLPQTADIHFYVITPWAFKDMKEFARNYELDKYSNVTVGYDYNNFVGAYYKSKGVPFTAVYDKQRRLKGSFLGNTDYSEIKKMAEL